MKSQKRERTNDNGIDIEQRINSGRTNVFDNEKDAAEYAKRIGSYPYEVYENSRTTGEWAVTK